MDKIENIDDIRSLIALGIEECTTLEYKSGIDTSNNHWKSEMAKDVSAMANANGGIIIYGVKEYDEEDKRWKDVTMGCITEWGARRELEKWRKVHCPKEFEI